MRTRLLALLACPECRYERLLLDALGQQDEEIVEGTLTCNSCGRHFPIIGGVPRLLPDALIGLLSRYHRAFFARHPVPVPGPVTDETVERTFAFYSFARPKLFSPRVDPALLAYWRRSLDIRVPAVATGPGRIMLDAGCGEGRYTYCLAEGGAEVVGLDLSEAVNQAYRRNRSNPRVHVIQGSIDHPPLRRGLFDAVVSTGVLHHLPNPERGFAALVPLLDAHGVVHVWVYGLRRMSLVYRLSHLRLLRRLLGHLSPHASYGASVPIALALHLLVFLPARMLDRWMPGIHVHPQLRDLAALPFKLHLGEVQDRIGVPITHYLSDDELRGWFESAGLSEVTIVQTGGGRGWSAWGARHW